MSGFSIRQQGPLGSTTASRTASLPEERARLARLATAQSPTTRNPTDRAPTDQAHTEPHPRDARGRGPAGEEPRRDDLVVAPATLFAVSQISAAGPAPTGDGVLRTLSAGTAWAPPLSSLSLRDRTV